MDELNRDTGTRLVKRGLAEMLKGGVIMDVVDAEQALQKGIKKVVFDRNGFIYNGRIKALAVGAREKGLQF